MKRRTGPFWRFYYGVYWLSAIGLGASVGISVTYRAFERPAQAAEIEALSEAECEARLHSVFTELRTQATKAFLTSDIVANNEEWRAFSTSWRLRLENTRAACRVRDPARGALARLAADVDRMHLAYTTALKGFGDVGQKPLNRIKASRINPSTGPGSAHD